MAQKCTIDLDVFGGLVLCSQCCARFSNSTADDEPRALHCGHSACTRCVKQKLMHWQQTANSGSQCSIECALDLKSTALQVPIVSNGGRRPRSVQLLVPLVLPQISTASLMLATANESPMVWRIFIRQLSGGVFLLHVQPNDTILGVKKRMEELNNVFAVHLQVYTATPTTSEPASAADSQHNPTILGDDERSLVDYRLKSGSTINMIVLDAYKGGVFLRLFKPERKLVDPHAMSMSSDGCICVCDESAERVVLFGTEGQFIRAFPLDDWKLPASVSIIMSSDDGGESIVAIADSLGHRVRILSLATGSVRQEFGAGAYGAAQGQLNAPFGACLIQRRWVDMKINDFDGFYTTRALLVADTMNHRLQEFCLGLPVPSSTIGCQGSGAGEFQMPSAVLLMKHGQNGGEETVVADTGNDRLQVFDQNGHRLTVTRAGANRLKRPRHLCASPDCKYLFVGEPRSVAVFEHDQGAYRFRHSIAVDVGVGGIGLNESGSELYVLGRQSGEILIFSAETASEASE